MKKITLILFTIAILFATTGLQVYQHYCAGKLEEVTLSKLNEKDCCGTTEAEDDCCRNEVKLLKLSEHFLVNHRLEIIHDLVLQNTIIPLLHTTVAAFHIPHSRTFVHPPPLLMLKVGMPVQYRSLLI